MKTIQEQRQGRRWMAWLAAGLLAGIGPVPGPAAARAAETTDDAPPAAMGVTEAEDASSQDVKAEVESESEHGGFHVSVGGSGSDGEIVKVGANAEVPKGHKVDQLVVIFGDATMDGEVDGDAVVVFGNAKINGKVRGELVNVMGSMTLGPEANVRGDCVLVGGTLTRDPAAQLAHEPVEVNLGGVLPIFQPLGKWFTSGLLLGRPLPPGVGLAWWFVAISLLIYFIIAILIPKPVEVCVRTLEDQTLTSFLVGLLGLILIGPLLFILLASGVGILLLPFLGLAFMAAVLLGKTACLQYLGLQLLRRFQPETPTRSLLAFFTGFGVVTLLYMVPLLGFVVWGVLVPLAFGGVLMAGFAALRRNNGSNGGPAVLQAPFVTVPSSPSPAPPTAPPPTPANLEPGVGSTGTESGTALLATSALLGSGATGTTGSPGAEVLALPRVGFWLRFAATLLDFVLLFWLIPTFGPLFVPAWIAYHVAMWMWKGTTIGGIVCGLKVVRLDGRPVDFSIALVRSLAAVFSFVALCLGFFWAGWTPERQAWHDMIAGTVIVKVPKGVSLI